MAQKAALWSGFFPRSAGKVHSQFVKALPFLFFTANSLFRKMFPPICRSNPARINI
jgi:hypothetical protein